MKFECLPTQMHSGCLEAGVDEAGRGCLAGPVVVASCILPEDFSHPLIQDSKKLSESHRTEVFEVIKENALDYHIEAVNAEIIDEINILEATMLGMNLCIKNLKVPVTHVLIDGNRFKWNHSVYKDVGFDYQFPEIDTVIHGDATYANIAAASILAKVTRDRIMDDYGKIYKEYNFIQNKGYGTKEHREAIKLYGFSEIHRKTFTVK